MSIKFSKEHEWINAANPEAAVVGITVHAQDALGDVGLGHQLRHYVKPLVIGGIDLFKRFAAKAVAYPWRRQKRRVITIECAKTLRVHATEHMPGNPLHRGQR